MAVLVLEVMAICGGGYVESDGSGDRVSDASGGVSDGGGPGRGQR